MKAASEALSTDKPAAVTFDTLAAAQELRTSGLEERQAEAIVTTISKAMSETVATKADLELQGAATRADIAATKADLELQIAETKAGLESQIAETKAGLESQIAETRADIEALKQSMISMQDKIVIRLGALMVTMTFLLLAFGPFYFRWVMSLKALQ